MSWTADDAAASSGAFVEVLRKLPGETTYMSIGASEGTTSRVRVMSFVDSMIPSTAAGLGVAYIIVPRRGAMRGEVSEAIAVQVGTRVGVAAVKLAA